MKPKSIRFKYLSMFDKFMKTITIPKEEYEELTAKALKIRLIDETIHKDLFLENIMTLQEKQRSLEFLKDKKEDIYTSQDLKETWKKER